MALRDFYRLAFNVYLDVVADRQTTGLEQHVPGQPEIAPIDLSVGAEADPLTAPWILGLAFELDVQRYLLCHIADGQISGELELLPVSVDARALETDLRILLH